ncbi:MAG: porin [Janthinobacterium lividum]
MKKSLISLAVCSAFSSFAHAQSSVTLYGVIDEAVQYNSNIKRLVNGVNVGGKQIGLDSASGPFGTRWGMKGVEDLGGGLRAIFVLESGFNLNTGAFAQGGTAFGRQAYVGLRSANLGTVTLGRQYDSVNDYVSIFGFPLAAYSSGATHPGDIDNLAHDFRANNTIKYASPNISGLVFGATLTLGGVAGQVSQNSGYSFGAGYSHGPLKFGAAYEFYKNPSAAGAVLNSNSNAVAPTATGNFTSLNSGYLAGAAPASSWQDIVAGGNYTFGNFLVAATYSNVRYGNIGQLNGASARFNIFDVNGEIHITPFMFVGAGYSYTKGYGVRGDLGNQAYHEFSAILDESLSKRTDIYVAATYQIANGTNSTGAPAVADIENLGDSSNKHQALVRLGFRQVF